MTQGGQTGALWNLEGWGGVGVGREGQEAEDACASMVSHVDVQQKPTQYCKAIILQLKINTFLKDNKTISYSTV